MIRTSNDFFNDFYKIIDLNKDIMNYAPSRLINYNINGEDIGPEDIIKIVKGIEEGDTEQFARWPYLEDYLSKTYDLIEDNRTFDKNAGNWPEIYGYGRPGVSEDKRNDVYLMVYNPESEMSEIIYEFESNEFRMTANELIEFFGLMKFKEAISLKSLERQGIETQNNKRIKLPSDIFKFGISPYIGKKKWEGGRTKGKKNKNNNKKYKTGRKTRKNKRRYYYNNKK
jgi:hypothetical protein